MLNMPTVAFLAAALALACFPALAANMPADDSKNFIPSGGTPSYFTNENVPVSGRVADTTAVFDSADDAAAAAVRSESDSAPSAHVRRGGHSRFATAHSARHSLGRVKGHGVSTRFAPGTIFSPERGLAKTEAVAKTKGGKHGRPGAQHASTAASHRG